MSSLGVPGVPWHRLCPLNNTGTPGFLDLQYARSMRSERGLSSRRCNPRPSKAYNSFHIGMWPFWWHFCLNAIFLANYKVRQNKVGMKVTVIPTNLQGEWNHEWKEGKYSTIYERSTIQSYPWILAYYSKKIIVYCE